MGPEKIHELSQKKYLQPGDAIRCLTWPEIQAYRERYNVAPHPYSRHSRWGTEGTFRCYRSSGGAIVYLGPPGAIVLTEHVIQRLWYIVPRDITCTPSELIAWIQKERDG